MKKFKKLTIIAAIVFAIFGFSTLLARPTYADNVCNHLTPGTEVYKANGCGGSSGTELSTVIVNIVSGIVGVLGLVAVIFIVVGGINYMTSAGDAGKLKKAKDTILYAVIGLIISALAFAIVNFVIGGIINNEGGSEEEKKEEVNSGGPISLILSETKS